MANAADDMDTQIGSSDGYGLSHSSLWRAIEGPAGSDPQSWTELGRPTTVAGTRSQCAPVPRGGRQARRGGFHRRLPGQRRFSRLSVSEQPCPVLPGHMVSTIPVAEPT
jgi:hypothetical protein